MELLNFVVFYGVIAVAFGCLQSAFFIKAKHRIIKILPISVSGLLFLLCAAAGVVKIHMIKNKGYYIQMSVDEVEVTFLFYLTAILAAVIGCALGIVFAKFFGKK